MNKEIRNWLLQGPEWLKYAVKTQLLNEEADVRPVLADPMIIHIIERLKDIRHGIPAIPGPSINADEYENPYWDLFFLADIGLKASEAGLETEIKGLLNKQYADGTYITEFGMEPSYFCKSAIILSSIARLGYQGDPHIRKCVDIFLKSQRLDGGWYCNPNHNIGAPLQYEPSCPQENLNILLLLGQYEEYRNNPRFNGAIDLLLKHWEARGTGLQIVYFGVGSRYQSLQYPATRYGILRVLDAISLYPYALKKASFHNMLEFVLHKGRDGKYSPQINTPYTNLEGDGQYSRWLTFQVERIDQRATEGR
jgi:hypothetical protein